MSRGIMTPKSVLSAEDFERIRSLDTCTVSNAIERFNVRLRNEGFIHGCVHCQFPSFQPMLGYAVTARASSSSAPMAVHCVGCVTNGAVRDLPAVEKTGFHLFAGSVAVSHSYAHLVDLGEPVEIGGLKIHPGDLVHGDRHGVHTIPHEIAAEIPKVAAALIAEERELIELCRSPGFSLKKLAARLRETNPG